MKEKQNKEKVNKICESLSKKQQKTITKAMAQNIIDDYVKAELELSKWDKIYGWN